MEQKFNNNRLDLQILREFCEREGEEIAYRKGDQLEREGDPARWFAFVTEGCFKYVKYGVSDDQAHITWFSFESEFVCDYPTFLYGRPSQATIEAMVPSRVRRVTGQQLELFFDQNMETMKLRAMIGEHILGQFRSRYLDLHCTTPRERYEMLLQRCPGIVEFLDLQDIASSARQFFLEKSLADVSATLSEPHFLHADVSATLFARPFALAASSAPDFLSSFAFADVSARQLSLLFPLANASANRFSRPFALADTSAHCFWHQFECEVSK